jgi:hypothetical protein
VGDAEAAARIQKDDATVALEAAFQIIDSF